MNFLSIRRGCQAIALKLLFFLVVGFLGSIVYAEPGILRITDFGAVGDSITVNSRAIQAAIDSCARKGGGTVLIPAGEYTTGTLHLRSHVRLYLQPGATLFGSKRREDYDAGPMRVIAPAGVITADSSYTPQVMVRNFGLSAVSFPVRVSIGAGYADSASVSNLAPGDSAIVQFRSWTAPGQGACPVRCTTVLAGDEFPENDAIAETARVYYRDIALVAITSPADTVDSGQTVWPRARVRNNGTQDETFLVYFQMLDEGYNHWTMARALPPGRETVLTFTPWTPQTPGDHYYIGKLIASDMDPSNDDLDGYIFVRAGAGIVEAAEPLTAAMPKATVIRGVLFLPKMGTVPSGTVPVFGLLDATGRVVLDLKLGANDVRALAPGVYFIRQAQAQAQAQAVRKVVVAR